MAKRTKNLFGLFGKKAAKTKPRAKSKLTIVEAERRAFAAGKKAGDTGGFRAWLDRSGLGDRSSTVQGWLRDAFTNGVLDRGRKPAKVVKGYRVWEQEPGDWRTSLEPESSFDNYRDAAAFVRSWKRNPIVPNPARPGTVRRVSVRRQNSFATSLVEGLGTGIGMGTAAAVAVPAVVSRIRKLGRGKL